MSLWLARYNNTTIEAFIRDTRKDRTTRYRRRMNQFSPYSKEEFKHTPKGLMATIYLLPFELTQGFE